VKVASARVANLLGQIILHFERCSECGYDMRDNELGLVPCAIAQQLLLAAWDAKPEDERARDAREFPRLAAKIERIRGGAS